MDVTENNKTFINNEQNYAVPTYAISDLRNFKKGKRISTFWNTRVIFIAGMKAQWDEVGGRLLLGDNAG